ncbi:MAG: hypothetical protein Q4G10_00165 [Bacteroidia bacterium]|nr:hypothetical protein [Bacteroidia bacterium]
MNKISRFFMAALPLFVTVTLAGQDGSLLRVTPEDKDMTVSVAGFDIKLGPSDRDRHRSGIGGSVDFFELFDLGMATMVCDRDIPDIRIPRSWNFSGDIISLSAYDNPVRRIKFSTGIRLSYYNYRLEDDLAMEINGIGIPELIGGCTYDKSKFKLTYLGVPVSIGVKIGHSLRLTGTATFDMLVDARNKVKDPKTKMKLDGLNPYRTSLELSLWGHYIGMFVNYGLSSIFSEASGLDAHTLSIGLKFID